MESEILYLILGIAAAYWLLTSKSFRKSQGEKIENINDELTDSVILALKSSNVNTYNDLVAEAGSAEELLKSVEGYRAFTRA